MSWMQKTSLLFLLPLLLFFTACAIHDKTVMDPEVKNYLMDLGSWDQPAPIEGTAQNIIKDQPYTETLDKVEYQCTETKYTLTANPEKIVMYSPDVEILWPGALIQGKSHKELGSLLGLIIGQRTPIKVSIPALPTKDNSKTVVNPDQAEVAKTIGEIIGNATMNDLKTPSTIKFEMRNYHSEQEFALSAGISGKYLGFRASASSDIEKTGTETTIAVQLYQKMYEVVVEPPQTPSHFFSADLTMEILQDQINLGRIHKSENIPIYVSNVVYGRMMMFTLTSKASETEIKAALNASYKGLTTEVEVELTAKQRQLLDEAKISITSLGGNAAATQAMIRTGNWKEYFRENPVLSSAVPLSYTFRNLRDGSIAKISESTSYVVRECKPSPKNFILANFDEGTENWKVPGGKGPEWVEWLNDDQSIMNSYIKAFEDLENFYYFKAPREGFLELINDEWYGGELSYWLRTVSDEDLKGYSPGWDLYGENIYLVGCNGTTLYYKFTKDEIPDWRGYNCDPEKGKSSCKKRFTDWHKFRVPLKSGTEADPNCWKKVGEKECADEQTIMKVLADVADLRIRGDFWTGKDYTALDEVKITKIPQPSTD